MKPGNDFGRAGLRLFARCANEYGWTYARSAAATDLTNVPVGPTPRRAIPGAKQRCSTNDVAEHSREDHLMNPPAGRHRVHGGGGREDLAECGSGPRPAEGTGRRAVPWPEGSRFPALRFGPTCRRTPVP
jgi:hypothetical protein